MINIEKKKFRKNVSILLNDLSWNIYDLGSFRNNQLSSYFFDIFKTYFLKGKSPEFSPFILIIRRCFSKVLIAFSIASLCFFGNFIAFNVNTIYKTVKIRPKDFRNFVFFGKSCIIFNENYFFTF